ncbi:N-succinylglutamate 5-semialdehyde dehydrogenase [Striga asiatica]|uniref:N-succinylglutamate 5-semialdehyde dehydrogenase n=1 Tax=Striga asiatica TaxID=4170 RepID=A0A5A7P4U0_STRAF|nr:N-succinylglutamate 5-semialdehyde dehydrogenase [Striga asiatica]
MMDQPNTYCSKLVQKHSMYEILRKMQPHAESLRVETALNSQNHNMPARVARCAGAAGGAQPPHEDPSKLPLQCESAQPGAGRKRKGRGPARGIEILRRLVHGKIRVDFDEEGGTWKAIGDDGPLYDSAVGILTRYYCKPIYDSWAEVPIEQRVQVLERLLRKSKTNSKNRAEHSWESKHGRISYAQHRSKKANSSINILQAAASTSGRVNERAIMEETFGRRRGHMTGVGPSLSRRAPTAGPQAPVLLPWGLDLQNVSRDQLVSLVQHLIGLLRQWAPNVQIPQVFPGPSGGSNSRNPNRFNDGAEDLDLND